MNHQTEFGLKQAKESKAYGSRFFTSEPLDMEAPSLRGMLPGTPPSLSQTTFTPTEGNQRAMVGSPIRSNPNRRSGKSTSPNSKTAPSLNSWRIQAIQAELCWLCTSTGR